MKYIKKGSIEGLEHYESPDAPWLVLIHGYGADASDLFSLKDFYQFDRPLNIFCPRGVLSVPIGPGWTGRAWWTIDMAEIQKSIETGIERDHSNSKPDKLEILRNKMYEALKFCAPREKIILGGFSQGAMLASDLYLNSQETFAGLVLFSGTLINKAEMQPLVAKKKGEKFFMSHGKNDTVLWYAGAQRLHTLLTEGGMQGSLQTFNGGHEIPMSVIQSSKQYIESQLIKKNL